MIDFLGKTIRIGDTIVYPGRQGSDMWMNIGKVMAIMNDQPYCGEAYKQWLVVKRENGKTYDVYRTDRAVVVLRDMKFIKVIKQPWWKRLLNPFIRPKVYDAKTGEEL